MQRRRQETSHDDRADTCLSVYPARSVYPDELPARDTKRERQSDTKRKRRKRENQRIRRTFFWLGCPKDTRWKDKETDGTKRSK